MGWTHWAISRSSQCSTTGVTKAMVCYPVCGMVHIKEPLLLIDKSSLCGSSGFPFSLSEWSLTICLTPYNRRWNMLSASLNKTFLSLSPFTVLKVKKHGGQKTEVTLDVLETAISSHTITLVGFPDSHVLQKLQDLLCQVRVWLIHLHKGVKSEYVCNNLFRCSSTKYLANVQSV